jgi:hypothetical protein
MCDACTRCRRCRVHQHTGATTPAIITTSSTLQETGFRTGQGLFLGRVWTHIGRYEQAVACFKEHWNIAQQENFGLAQASAALLMGEVLYFQARIEPTDSAGEPEASGHRSVRARVEAQFTAQKASADAAAAAGSSRQLRAAAEWLRTAVHLAQKHKMFNFELDALWHLSCLMQLLGEEEEALGCLKGLLDKHVVLSSDHNWCAGCRQCRHPKAPLLTCDGCSIARSARMRLALMAA